MCKKKRLPEVLKVGLYAMIRQCEIGEFVKAHEIYLDLAIGRAHWPMGMTRTSIHDRGALERISESKITHILNNEEQRNMLGAIDRLRRYNQELRPDVSTSKKC